MIFYLLDFLINNLGLYTSSLILIRVDDFGKEDLIYIFLLDVFFNKIPIIFILLLIIKLINKRLRIFFTKSLLVDNIIYIFNYLIFMTVIFIYSNSFIFLNLGLFYVNNFLINYLLFWFLKIKE